jgi:hypothetical protein
MERTEQIHIYCTPELREKLRKIAEADNRSMTKQMEVLIEKAYSEFLINTKYKR